MAERAWITDPKRLKALAHPIRWRLMDVLAVEGSATATRCAAVIGESVASCSYHLNTLAKYGYVEQAEGGQGREKPWRATEQERNYTTEGLDDEGVLAAEAATEAFVEHEYARMREYVRNHGLETEAWRRGTGFTGMLAFLTPQEAEGLAEEIRALFDRYQHRRKDVDSRPTGARPVRLLFSEFVVPRSEPTP